MVLSHEQAARDEMLADHDLIWPPQEVAYLWDWFCNLTDWRQVGGMIVGPLSHLEMECWSRLMGLNPPIRPHEVDILRQLDRQCRNYYFERSNPEPKGALSIKQMKDAVDAAKKDRNLRSG